MNIETFIFKRIHDLCEKQCMSKYRLSKLTGISQSAFSQMEKKQSTLSIITIEKICNAFGITISQFFSTGDEFIDLTETQKELLNTWDYLDEKKKKYILDCMKGLQNL